MRGYVPLPQFRAASPVDFRGLNQGIDAIGAKLKENRLLDQNKAIGQAIQDDGYGAGADAAFAQGNLSVGSQLAGAESADEQREFQRNRLLASDRRSAGAASRSQQMHDVNFEKARLDLEDRANSQLGTIANTIKSAAPGAQSAMWQTVLQTRPNMAEALTKYGVDPNDVNAGTDFFIAQARGLRGAQPQKLMSVSPGNVVIDAGGNEVYTAPPKPADQGSQIDSAKFEQSLRKEYAGLAKNYRAIQEGADRVRVGAELDNAVGDLSLIFGYMKLLDPGSVVREGEFANAENAQGVPDQVRNTWNKIMTGERLNPRTRLEFVNAATALSGAQLERQNRIDSQFRSIAQESGVEPDRVIMDFGSANGSVPNENDPLGIR